MKKKIRRLFHSFGYTITRLDSRVEIDCAWGPNILLYALEDLANRSSKPLKIVQIGAHDGSDQDPLQPFLLGHNCEAILIEPMEHPYTALASRYCEKENIHTIQAAISDRDASMEMHYIVDEAGNPDLTLFSSFSRNTIERNLVSAQESNPNLRGHRIRSKVIKARTLKSVLRDYGMQSVDAIVLDTKGLDHKIVQSFLNDGVEPRIIRFEYCNLSLRDFDYIKNILLGKGYEIARVGIDIYCQKVGLLR